MDLSYAPEQLALKESATRFLTDRYGFDVRRRIETSPQGNNQEIWNAFAELGWLSLPFAASEGGLDGIMVDVALLTETFGAALVAEPYVSTAVLCGGLVTATATPVQRASLIPAITEGRMKLAFAHDEPGNRHDYGRIATRATRTPAGWRLDGQKAFALDAPIADQILVSARLESDAAGEPLALFLVAPGTAGLITNPYPIVDGRRAANIALEGVLLPTDALLGGMHDRTDAITTALDRTVIALAADAIGAMQVLLDKTIAHTKTRVQFGQPLAANQVLKHRMVDMAVRIEEARSITLKAAIRADDGSPDAVSGRAVAAAKVKVAAAARFVAEQAVQLHGAMGVTDELDIGAYFKRLLVFEVSYGTPSWHLRRYTALRDAAPAAA